MSPKLRVYTAIVEAQVWFPVSMLDDYQVLIITIPGISDTCTHMHTFAHIYKHIIKIRLKILRE